MRDRIAPAVGLLIATMFATETLRAATFNVTVAANSGVGSLRQAILDANGSPGADVIAFDPGLAGATIALTSPLPNPTEPIDINADLGGDCVPDVNVSGAGAGSAATGLTLGASSSRVRGLALHSWSRAAILAFSNTTAIVIECNHFGTDLSGTAVLPNGSAGGPGVGETGQIELMGNTHRIGPGNLIVNGRGPGVRITEANNGAYPNFTALSSDAVPRVYAAIAFSDSCGRFSGGGFTPIDGSGAPFTENFGMRLRGRITVGAAGDYSFDFSGLDDNATLRIDGGVIGSMQGQSPPPLIVNLSSGMHTIEIDFLEGLGAAGLAPTITGPGSIALSSDDQLLCATEQVGLCAELFQLRVPSEGIRITRNRMRDNAGPGIRLGFNGCGLLTNDAGDVDLGPNTLLNSPTITAFDDLGGGDFSVTGTAAPNSTVELFLAAQDPNGFGEGSTFLVSTTASGGGNFVAVAALPSQGVVTATATDAAGNTSQFGRNFSYSTGATGLYAKAQSTGSIELSWIDPDLGETGFRVERSTNGTTFSPVITLGAEATSHIDTGLTANTLYYYRVIATTPGGDAPASNRASASTFPSTAAKVCYQRIDRSNGFVTAPSVVSDGSGWAAAWLDRDVARDNTDILFRRFHATTLAPLTPLRTISDVDSNIAAGPLLAWNGTRYGVLWAESVIGAAGSPRESPWFFALLDADGQRLSGPIRVPLPIGAFLSDLIWDGSHWGLVYPLPIGDVLLPQAFSDVQLLRLSENGQATGPAVALTATATQNESFVAAAWNAVAGHYGVAFLRSRDLDAQWLFQRFSATGAPIDPLPVELDAEQFSYGEGVGFNGLSLIFDGTNWAFAYGKDDPAGLVESAVWLRRISGTTGQPIDSGPTRLSDDAPDSSGVLRLLPKPGGGYSVFTLTSPVPSFQAEVGRMQATAAGARDGAQVLITPNDGIPTFRPSVAGNTSDFLLLYADGNDPTQPAELYAVRVAADGLSPPQPSVFLTSGHDPTGSSVPNPISVASVGAGFAALWTDGFPAAPRLNVRIWDGAGQIVSTLAPLTATSVRQPNADMIGVGNTFAVAWKTTSNNVIFKRYNGTGGSLTNEMTLATAVGGGHVLVHWNGEHYGVFYAAAGGARYQRVDDAGNLVGAAVVLPRNIDGQGQASVQWLGDSWALVTRATGGGNLDYLRIAADGTLLDGPLTVATALHEGRGVRRQQLHYNGRELGLAYGNWLGFDPPSENIYFTVVNRDGTLAFPPVTAVGTSQTEISSNLYSVGANFRLSPNVYGLTSGIAEFQITPTGAVSPLQRYLSHRSSAVNRLAHAHNGRALGMLQFPGGQQHLYFHTDACLADATPPPCPTLTATQSGNTVQASWTAVSDAESGVIRYVLYRDGLPLAETDADVLSYVDGFDATAPNVYQVRALNGAFVESASCPTQALSTLIFRDGFEG